MPRNKHPEETVKKILDTSLALFAEKGFEQTTVLDIVNNLGGLTRGAFYHHFKSKEEVLAAIFQRDEDENNFLNKALDAEVDSGLERVRHALRLSLTASAENPQRIAVSNLAHSLLKSPRFLAEHIQGIKADSYRLATLLDEGMKDGSIKQGNPLHIAELFMLLANLWMMPNLFPSSKEDAVAKVKMIEQIFAGLGYDFIEGELTQLYIGLLDELYEDE